MLAHGNAKWMGRCSNIYSRYRIKKHSLDSYTNDWIGNQEEVTLYTSEPGFAALSYKTISTALDNFNPRILVNSIDSGVEFAEIKWSKNTRGRAMVAQECVTTQFIAERPRTVLSKKPMFDRTWSQSRALHFR
ncbi:unnamed protein product [Sphenostylis stenocarpa]|uniref:Uncharacterized protein n=1 Tax=Sphenostylis stenocarpa TaxID=92480 RepID=A0AA86SZI3_9FABA|nr:unnamed protein product [Sphenostylis stenocarpa]